MVQIAGVDPVDGVARPARPGIDRHPHLQLRTDQRDLKAKVKDLRPRRRVDNPVAGKGGKQHTIPCHRAVAEVLRAYIEAADIAEDRKSWLFRTARGHNGTMLSANPMSQPDAWRMIRRRAAAADIAAEIGCHTFRATGITAYLANGGTLEYAQEMAA
jgi:integrase